MLELVVEGVAGAWRGLAPLLPYLLALTVAVLFLVGRAAAVLQPHRPVPDLAVPDLAVERRAASRDAIPLAA